MEHLHIAQAKLAEVHHQPLLKKPLSSIVVAPQLPHRPNDEQLEPREGSKTGPDGDDDL